ncbi:MAG TPA: HlyD family secretion protein [Holophagaceae bacterium]|nr:HlyD family secretion protein [Holophagaceae bacterium]
MSDIKNEETAAPAPAQVGSEGGRALRAKLKRIFTIGGITVLVLGAALAIYSHNRVSTDDAQVDGHSAPISARVSGSVQEILVQDNQVVKAGQVLVKLDPRDLQAEVAQAQASLDAAIADARKARLSAVQGRTSDMARARAMVAAQAAISEKAQADLARLAPLAQRAEISQQQFDAAKAEAKVASSQLAAAGQLFDAVRQEAGSRQAGAEAQDAKTEKAKADLDALKLKLSYCTITAPVDGIVTRKTVQIGQVLQPGQSLMTVVPEHSFVIANFKETQLAKMRPGQKAEVEVDMNGKTLDATVDSISAATGASMSLLPPENATGNFVKVVQRIPVKITFDAKDATDAGLRPGMNVTVTVFTK